VHAHTTHDCLQIIGTTFTKTYDDVDAVRDVIIAAELAPGGSGVGACVTARTAVGDAAGVLA
jgi:hypothetical protein